MRKRGYIVILHLNEKELHHLEHQTQITGLSKEALLRTLLIYGKALPKPCKHHDALLRQISGLCNNANQLAHMANSRGGAKPEEVKEMLDVAKDVQRIVKKEW